MGMTGTIEGSPEGAVEGVFEGGGGAALPVYEFLTEQTGSTVGYNQASFYGSLTPTEFGGVDCTDLVATTAGNDHIRISFSGGVQVAGVDQITITIEGAPESSYVLDWSAGTLSYRDDDDARAVALRAYLAGENGNTLDVTMQATG